MLDSGKVCSWGNTYTGSECRDSNDIVIATGFDLTTCQNGIDPADDWAILNLVSPMPSTTAEFDLSQQTSLGSREIKSFGFPAFVPGSCGTNTGTAINTGYGTAQLYHQNGVNITDYSGAKARATMDGMAMQSGSPVFYCIGTDDDCDAGEQGGVAMTLAAWETGLTDRWAGPRIVSHRNAILLAIH